MSLRPVPFAKKDMNSLIPTIFFSSTLELFTEEISLQTDSRTALCGEKRIQALWVSDEVSATYNSGDKKMNHPCLSTGMTLLFALIFEN